jgi:hypothetical protein
MIKIKDILYLIILSLTFFIIGIIISISDWFNDNLPFSFLSIFILIIIYGIIWKMIKQRRKITAFVEPYFIEKGYKILSERPVKLSEIQFKDIKVKIEPAFINNIPLSRYKYVRKFFRVFTVIDSENKNFEIIAEVTYHWNKDLSVEILAKKEIGKVNFK